MSDLESDASDTRRRLRNRSYSTEIQVRSRYRPTTLGSNNAERTPRRNSVTITERPNGRNSHESSTHETETQNNPENPEIETTTTSNQNASNQLEEEIEQNQLNEIIGQVQQLVEDISPNHSRRSEPEPNYGLANRSVEPTHQAVDNSPQPISNAPIDTNLSHPNATTSETNQSLENISRANSDRLHLEQTPLLFNSIQNRSDQTTNGNERSNNLSVRSLTGNPLADATNGLSTVNVEAQPEQTPYIEDVFSDDEDQPIQSNTSTPILNAHC